jgi:hypothetical protein
MLLIQVVFCIQLTPRASIHPIIGFQSAIPPSANEHLAYLRTSRRLDWPAEEA